MAGGVHLNVRGRDSIYTVDRSAPIGPAWAEGGDVWQSLYTEVPAASPYLCTPWVRTWVETFALGLATEQLIVRDADGKTRGSCLLSVRTDRRAALPLRRAFLNTSGESDADSVVVEHNAALCASDHSAAVYQALAEYLNCSLVDEIQLNGGSECAVEAMVKALPQWRAQCEWRESPYVNLTELRSAGREYQSALSRNTREQLRRSLRKYGEWGEVTLRVAGSTNEALTMFDSLVQLHDARWNQRGDLGGFATTTRRAFHKSFIMNGHSLGNAQLLEIRAGNEIVGVLYNLVANGHVCFYQSGLKYDADARLKPGFVAHVLAVEHYLRSGYTLYDFLPSAPNEGRYKSSLATHSMRLGTLLLQRPGWRQAWFDTARRVRQRLRVAKA